MKLMPDDRRMVGDFEIVDFASDARVEEIRDQLKVPYTSEVSWQWNYGSEVGELRSLYEKGKDGQWNAMTDIDWPLPVDRESDFASGDGLVLPTVCRLLGKNEATIREAIWDEINWILSQLLHGEQAALQLCGQLTNMAETTDEKWYAASQVVDEARHIEVFAHFLNEKMGKIYPISPSLKILLDELLVAETYHMKTLGMQTLFEGMAVGIMDGLREGTSNELFYDMIRRVQGDEARHAAFGVLTMRRCVERCSEAERSHLEDWAFAVLEGLNANQQLDMLRAIGPKYEIEPDKLITMIHGLDNWAETNATGFMHTVIPNLQRLGLITEQTEAGWRSCGMLIDNRSETNGRAFTLPPSPAA